jgi:ADP-heptose:LPS heptosyltransferase
MNLLVLALASSGDALFLVEPLAARRAARPQERITIAAPPGACDVLRSLGLAHAAWNASQPGAPVGVASYRTAALFARAARGRFDQVIDVFPHVRSTITARLATVTRPTGRGGTSFLEALVRLQANLGGVYDPVDRIARTLDVSVDREPPMLVIDSIADAWVERALKATGFEGGEPVVAVHGGGHWPVARFVDVAEGLRSHFEARLVVLDMPKERSYAKAISGSLGGRVLGMVAPPAPRFLAALARASACITDDPGTAYLAGVLRVPVVLVAAADKPLPPPRLGCVSLTGQDVESVTAATVYEQACKLVRRDRTGPLFAR